MKIVEPNKADQKDEKSDGDEDDSDEVFMLKICSPFCLIVV